MVFDLELKFKNIDEEYFTMYWGKPKNPGENPPQVDLTLGKALLNCLRMVKGETERDKAYFLLKKIKKAGGSVEIKKAEQIAFLQKAVKENFPDNYLMGQICDYLDGKSPEDVPETDSE